MEKIHPFSVRLPELLLGEISRIATAENRSKGQVAIMAISEGLRTRGINGGEWMAITKIEVEKNAAGENRVGTEGSGGVCDLGGINSGGDGSGQGNRGEHGAAGKSGDNASSNAGGFIKGRVTRKKIADDSARVVGENPACAPMGKPDKPDMDVLRAICAGNIPPNTIPVTHDGSDHFYAENFSNFEGWDKLKPVDVDLCWHKEYNPDTGQTGACGRPKGHKGKCGAWEVVE